MNKLVSFVVFIAAFIGTWFLFHTETKVSVDVHAGLQSKLAVLIENSIKNARPTASDFQILSLYTKRIDDNKVTAYFSYRFKEDMEEKERTEQTISGEAVLNRTPSENPDDQKWVVQSVKTGNSTIEFQDGTVINTAKDAQAPDAPAQTPPPATPPGQPEEKKTE